MSDDLWDVVTTHRARRPRGVDESGDVFPDVVHLVHGERTVCGRYRSLTQFDLAYKTFECVTCEACVLEHIRRRLTSEPGDD